MNTAEQLTQIFKDNFVVYFRSHVAHVNITGRNFRSDHKLLQGVYERRQAEIDKIAEILRTMDEFMPTSIADVCENSTIPTDAIEGSADEMLEAVMMDLEHLLGDFKDLINSFVVILKQIVEHRLPRDYDYHRIPAPWIQMKILEILSYLGADDKASSELMYDIVSQVLKRADDSGINIGYALVY